MSFTDIRLQNFRSYQDDSFELAPGVNIIVGPNASGKTNLLESILVLSLTKSYKAKDVELVSFDKPWARIDGHTKHGVRTIKLVKQDNGKVKKELLLEDAVIRKISINHQVPAVLFEPNHLQLLTGSPELRRDYLDDLIEQFVPGFSSIRKQYRRALQQRNFLLKNNSTNDQLFVWNLRLSDLGGQLAMQRQLLVEHINKSISNTYKMMSGSKADITAIYESSCAGEQYSTRLLHKLETSQDNDQKRGFTGHGPHRDDLALSLNGHGAAQAASRGEMRTLLLALKVIELQLLEEHRGVKPILLMDDVFSELDGARRKALTEAMKGYQTFITTTDADIVVKHFTNCHVIPTKSA